MPMPVKKRDKADTALCLNFCQYYKPGRNEDLSCQGFIVVHGIMQKGRNLPLERPDKLSIPDSRTAESLRKKVCGVCEFHAADCDFILTGGAAAPCGGFALLSHLLESGELTLEEIEEAAGPAAR
jgi:hypothetical protein